MVGYCEKVVCVDMFIECDEMSGILFFGFLCMYDVFEVKF